jgi:hypothetical protein
LKICTRCGVELFLDQNWYGFSASRNHYRCKSCILLSRKSYYEEKHEEIKDKRKEYRQEKPELIMYTRIKGKAKRMSIPFDLELSDIVIPSICPALGVPLVIGERSPYNPSLDRIDPKKGYVKGNVVVISKRANTIKNDATADELRKVATFVDELLVTRFERHIRP